MELGLTLTGPHRDDLSVTVDGKLARLFASEGQKKTAIAALKLAEWERLAQTIHEPPLMAIDELGLPLDETRQHLVWTKLKGLGQVFITTAVPGKELESSHQIKIKSGAVYIQNVSP